MIARHWHGRVPATLAADYLKLMGEVALPDYRRPPKAIVPRSPAPAEGEIVHVEMLTLWEDEGGNPALRGRGHEFLAIITISTRITCSSSKRWCRA